MSAPQAEALRTTAKQTFAGKNIALPMQWKSMGPLYPDAFGPPELSTPANAPDSLFHEPTLNKYHTRAAGTLARQYGLYIDGICAAICDAIDTWMHAASNVSVTLAGTRDNTWRLERSPRQPLDFNYHFYNGAHPDLQVKGYLTGNEPVELIQLTPEGRMRFALPGIRPLCRVLRTQKPEEEKIAMNLDTVFIEPEVHRFCLVWRGNAALAELSEAGIDRVTLSIESIETKS